jgi:three-Cys-motif partner protein
MDALDLDEIGKWSEIKLEIIREYAKPYSTILANQPNLYHIYIDGFAGAGLHVSKSTGQQITGSPINVNVDPPFREYHLVELKPAKAKHLRKLFADERTVRVHEGDCNEILSNELLPQVQYKQFRRALCLLDPYGLHLDWKVIRQAGDLGTVDLLLNFPMMDMNMNVLWHDPDSVKPEQAERMTRFWGDDSWKRASYAEEPGLFGPIQKKALNEVVAQAFAKRLKDAGNFKHVAEPLPMRNSTNAIVYYLFFASNKPTATKIITAIFNKHKAGGAS